MSTLLLMHLVVNELITHYVPATLFVFTSESFGPNILAILKSDIFGFISISSKMLLGFKSLWIILNLE